MKTIYLHIGKHKTGSTSIQHYLLANRTYFKKNGFHITQKSIYPFVCPEKIVATNCTNLAHIALRNSILTPIRLRGKDTHRTFLKKVRDAFYVNTQLHKINSQDIIISAEAFSFIRTRQEKLILSLMFKGFNLIPIVFLRNAQDWLRSWQSQLQSLIRSLGIAEPLPEGIFDFNAKSWMIDDTALLKVFGKNIKAIHYEEAIEQYNSVIPAFLETLNLNIQSCPPWDDFWQNKSQNLL